MTDWSFSFQSESPTGEPWLGPDILDHLEALHGAGTDGCSCVPSGSCPIIWRSAGTSTPRRRRRRPSSAWSSSRIEMPNADPDFVDVLAEIVNKRLAGDRSMSPVGSSR